MRHLIISKRSISFCLTVLMFMISCQKQSGDLSIVNTTNSELIGQAKIWLQNGPVMRDQKTQASQLSALGLGDVKRQLARMSAISKKLEWQNTSVIKENGEVVLVVPLAKEKAEVITKQVFGRALAFHFKKSQEINLLVIEFLTEKGELLPNNINKVITESAKNKIFNLNADIETTNLSMFFYDDSYKATGSFKLKDSKWLKSTNLGVVKLVVNSDDKTFGNITASSPGGGTPNCVLWGVYVYHYEDGVLVGQDLLYSYWVCTYDYLDDDVTGGGGGGGEPNIFDQSYFNNYIASSSSPTNYEFSGQENGPLQPSPNTGYFDWAVTTASFGGWTVTATTDFGFYKYLYSTPTGLQYEYNIVNYNTRSIRYLGSNTFITSTLMGATPTDIVTNNNSTNAKGNTTVTGSIKHRANIEIPNPTGGPPVTLENIDNISGSCTFRPR